MNLLNCISLSIVIGVLTRGPLSIDNSIDNTYSGPLSIDNNIDNTYSGPLSIDNTYTV